MFKCKACLSVELVLGGQAGSKRGSPAGAWGQEQTAEGDRLAGARLDAVCKARQSGPNCPLWATGHVLWNGETNNSLFSFF